MFEVIAQEISNASARREKAVMIHFQVLINADRLGEIDGLEFCKKVNIEPSWAIEFKKMMNLARFLKANGISIENPL